MVLVKNLNLFQLLTTVELCVSIEWVSKFAFYVAQGQEKMVDSPRVKLTL